jgi:hypothetical protein
MAVRHVAVVVDGWLGWLGWLGWGPLLATLIVGRTGLMPGARWLTVCAIAWTFAAGAAWLINPPRGSASPLGQRTVARPLIALAATLPLLVVLYVDDSAYHLAAGSPAAPRAALSGYAALVLFAGLAGTAVASRLRDDTLVPPGTPSGKRWPLASDVPSAPAITAAGALPGGVALLLGVAIMLTINRGILAPLASARAPALDAAGPLAANLCCLVAAAWIAARTQSSGVPGAMAMLAAFLAFGPVADGLSRGEPTGVVVLSGAAALWLIRREHRLGPTLLGGLSGIVPAVAGGIVALGLLGRWRDVAAGLVGAVVVGGLRLASGSLPDPVAAAGAFWGSPHFENAALGGLHSRLLLGADALTAADAVPHLTPSLALSLGTLGVGTWLAGRAVTGARGGWDATRAVALGLLVTLALAGTTPASHLSLACLALVPVARGLRPGEGRPTRWLSLLALGVAGYLLVGTSTAVAAQAGAELLSRWPALAALPSLGLLLLALATASGSEPRGANWPPSHVALASRPASARTSR